MANGHGGYRPGSGRKPGIPNSKTLEIRDRAAREGITPLEVMLSIMKERLAAGNQDGALVAANMAAPYMHSRLAATAVKMDAEVRSCVISSEPMTAEEWVAKYGRNDAEPLSAGP
jgi:hypothetical protein